MNTMIMIPTLGRVDLQKAYNSLPREVKKITRLIVSQKEKDRHIQKKRKIIVCPKQGRGMAGTRQWMLDYAARHKIKKIIMLDDDLQPQTRIDEIKIVRSTEEQIKEAFRWMIRSLDDYVHCAWSERSFSWSSKEEHKVGTKGICCVGYNVKEVVKSGCKFNKNTPDSSLMQDYHMTLQLFEKGLPNIVSLVHRYGAPGALVAPGGCAKFRTKEGMEDCSKRLQRLHPKFVKAVEKQTKSTYGGNKHWDVRVQWKKALEHGTKKDQPV